MSMIKILIADDQELIRQSLQIMLSSVSNFTVTDTVSNGLEVLESVRREKPDVILMDIRMPEMDGVVCIQKVKEYSPDIKVIILTTFDDDEYIFNAIKFGASGYLLKGISMKELSDAIRKVYNGTAMINEDIASKVLRSVLTAVTGVAAAAAADAVTGAVTGTKKKSTTSTTKKAVTKATKSATTTLTRELTRSILGNLIK